MKYEDPIIEIVNFEIHDVICSSNELENGGFGDYDGGFAPKG